MSSPRLPFARWLAGRNSDRRAATIGLIGAAVAVAAVLFGGFLPTPSALVTILYLFATFLPALGVAIALGALWWVYRLERTGLSSLVDGDPPESGNTDTTERVARETTQLLADATANRYTCFGGLADEEVCELLTEALVRRLGSKRGLSRAGARDAIEDGTWTDDPIAAAFLSEERPFSLSERLRTAVDPGVAYERRLRRTLEAIETLEATPDESADGTAQSSVNSESDDRTRHPGVQKRTQIEPEVSG